MLKLIPWQPFFCSIMNRCRGGLIDISEGQLARVLLWALPLAATIFSVQQPDDPWDKLWYFVELVGTAFIGEACVNWGKYDTEPNNFNWAMLTVQGLIYLGPIALVVAAYGFFKLSLAILISVLFMAPCYWLGWRIPSKVKGFEQGIPCAEILFGFDIGLNIYLQQFVNL